MITYNRVNQSRSSLGSGPTIFNHSSQSNHIERQDVTKRQSHNNNIAKGLNTQLAEILKKTPSKQT